MLRSLLCLLVLSPVSTLAYDVVVTEVSEPYEIIPVVSAHEVEQFHLGRLEGYPVMYEIIAEEPFRLQVQVEQSAQREPEPLALIAIRQNDRGGGVTEVARMGVEPDDWTREKDPVAGVVFLTSPALEADVSAGTYRIEVSSPENRGVYRLKFGNQSADAGYIDTLRNVRVTQAWFGYGVIQLLQSRLVYIPLCMLIGLLGVRLGWRVYQTKVAAHRTQ